MRAAAAELDVMPFEPCHLDAAARLFVEGYRAQRALVPTLPERYTERAEVMPLLRGLVLKYPGVVAVDRGDVVGYLAGMFLSNFKGSGRGVYCPEWAHAASHTYAGRDEVYAAMYSSICKVWVAEGCINQAVTVLADDREVLDAWYWFGFGMIVVDAIRGMQPVNSPEGLPDGFSIRLAGPGDSEILFPLMREHTRYYPEGPIFLPKTEQRDPAEIQPLLVDPRVRIWVAFDSRRQAVGLIQGEPGADGACQVVRDSKTASITGAYVKAELRRAGIGLALLRAVTEWAAGTGCARVSVDFESANLPGRAFWLKHFEPVCYSVLRHVDDRVVQRRRAIV